MEQLQPSPPLNAELSTEELIKQIQSLKEQLAALSEEAQITIEILIGQREQAANAAATLQKDLTLAKKRLNNG